MRDDANYYRCSECKYEFLGGTKNPACPKCKSIKLEGLDIRALTGLDG
jgi:predicted Zn-ribbon and HTH transcriptional regulator